MDFPDKALKVDSKRATSPMLRSNANMVVRVDSTRNWAISCGLVEPVTLRMPISFARLADRAVVRFI